IAINAIITTSSIKVAIDIVEILDSVKVEVDFVELANSIVVVTGSIVVVANDKMAVAGVVFGIVLEVVC
ncbi:6909_t:CDS:1, partial [Dentiscutata heterogama]